MSVVSSNNLDSIKESDTQQKSSEEALHHLDKVIEHVISEAVEYADQSPEERTLPALIRQSVLLASTRQKNVERMNIIRDNAPHRIGFSHIGGLECNPFSNGVSSDNRVSFETVPASTGHHNSQQQIMARYNGSPLDQYNFHQQYAQAAQQLHLEQQKQQEQQIQSKYHLFTQMQHQQQQAHSAKQQKLQQQASSIIGHSIMYPTTTCHVTTNPFSTFSTLSLENVVNTSALAHTYQQVQTVQQQQAAIAAQRQAFAAVAAQQQLNQITAAYAAANQLPGMATVFSPDHPNAAAQQRWSSAAAYQIAATAAQQHRQLEAASILRRQQQQQYLPAQQQLSQHQSTAAAVSDQLARYTAYNQQQYVKKMQE